MKEINDAFKFTVLHNFFQSCIEHILQRSMIDEIPEGTGNIRVQLDNNGAGSVASNIANNTFRLDNQAQNQYHRQ